MLKRIFFLVTLLIIINDPVCFAQDINELGPGLPVIRGIKARLRQAAKEKGFGSGAGLGTFSAGVGTSSYFGDLCDDFSCMVFRPNFGISYMYRWDRRLSFKVESNFYMLNSKDVYPARNFSFRSSNVEFYMGALHDFFSYHRTFKKRKRINPYVFGGVGLTYFNPKAKYNGKWYSLQPLHTEGDNYSRFTMIIPFGLGLRIKSAKGIEFMLEAGYRKTFSDRLDDVSSHKYQPIASFSDPVAAALSNRTGKGDNYKAYRGNPGFKDGYCILQLKVSYTPRLKPQSLPRFRPKGFSLKY
jgi:hypothetical protein